MCAAAAAVDLCVFFSPIRLAKGFPRSAEHRTQEAPPLDPRASHAADIPQGASGHQCCYLSGEVSDVAPDRYIQSVRNDHPWIGLIDKNAPKPSNTLWMGRNAIHPRGKKESAPTQPRSPSNIRSRVGIVYDCKKGCTAVHGYEESRAAVNALNIQQRQRQQQHSLMTHAPRGETTLTQSVDMHHFCVF